MADTQFAIRGDVEPQHGDEQPKGPHFVSGAIVKFEKENDTTYVATQVSPLQGLPLPKGAHKFDFSFGPVKITGYVDFTDFSIDAKLSVLGITLGQVHGDLHKGVQVNVNLFLASGYIRFFLKGKEVWVHIHLDIKFDGKIDKEFKLLSL